MRYCLFFAVIFFAACNSNIDNQEAAISEKDTAKPYSPIEGNWVLVSNEVYGKMTQPKRFPQQVKMFHDGYYAFVMYDAAGNFYYAGAGPYEVNGNMYKETFAYATDTTDVDAWDTQRWEIKGDTLIFYGFEKAALADGTDVTEKWGKHKFVEKRVRLKR
ncbi:hypothetical protein DC498_14620 [Terrimonas sp.]|uniref:hypothetical protein n=1 Tax=Terrimonas sp. TaxID=1914338 RepID=UPI000D508FA8|nr:hypothetical protein [Terrimonas sp.]PVD51373.1 hypothetical protein DC498_14620 [Terrimonas sp.]